jgi:Na+/proline symporter
MPLLQSGVSFIADRMPEVIEPGTHAVLDYAMAATFITAGALFWRRHRRAAIGSFICGATVAATSILTDYRGGLSDKVSYDTHGKIDAGVAGLASAIPSAMFFRKDPQAKFFLAAGIAATVVTALTNFSSSKRHSVESWRERRSA